MVFRRTCCHVFLLLVVYLVADYGEVAVVACIGCAGPKRLWIYPVAHLSFGCSSLLMGDFAEAPWRRPVENGSQVCAGVWRNAVNDHCYDHSQLRPRHPAHHVGALSPRNST